MHLEPVDQYGQYLSAQRRELITEAEEFRLHDVNELLSELLNKVFDARSDALYVFYVLNHRIDFMGWLLESLMESQDPRLKHDYKFRAKEDQKFTPPKAKESSTIAPLILGLYQRIDDYLVEINTVVSSSIEGKIFLYPQPIADAFNSQTYVTNLNSLAQSGVLPAKVLQLMIEKLNLYATVLGRLKTAFHTISRSEYWERYALNLSAGGLSFVSDAAHPGFALFNKLHVFMAIESQVMVCSGKVVTVKKIEPIPHDKRLNDKPVNDKVASDKNAQPLMHQSGLSGCKVSIEFEFLTTAQQQGIELFLQRKELRDAMATVAL
jgi:hypothetical protein